MQWRSLHLLRCCFFCSVGEKSTTSQTDTSTKHLSRLWDAATSVVRCCISSASFSGLELLTGKRLRVPCSFSFPKIQRRPGRPQTWPLLLPERLAARHPYRWQKSTSGWGITNADFEEQLTATLTDGKLISLSQLTACMCEYLLEQQEKNLTDGLRWNKLDHVFFFFLMFCFVLQIKVKLWKQLNYS